MSVLLVRVVPVTLLVLSVLTVAVQFEMPPAVSCDENLSSSACDILQLSSNHSVSFNDIPVENLVRTKRQIIYPTFEYLTPSGVRMHITAPGGWWGSGYQVKTHVNINQPLSGKVGQYNGEAITSGGSEFHWDIPDIRLKRWDTIYYYVEFIDQRPTGRRNQDIYGTSPVNEANPHGSPNIQPSYTVFETPSNIVIGPEEAVDTRMPQDTGGGTLDIREGKNPTFQFFSPSGLRVHIPVPDGYSPVNQKIKVHLSFNQPISGDVGQVNGEEPSTRGPGWYWDAPQDIHLRRGDTIYYLVEVIEDRQYRKRWFKYTGTWPINERDPHIGKPTNPSNPTSIPTPTRPIPTPTRPVPIPAPPIPTLTRTTPVIRPTATQPVVTRPTFTRPPPSPPTCRQSLTTNNGRNVCQQEIINAAKPFSKVAKFPSEGEEWFTLFSTRGRHVDNQGSTTVYRIGLLEDEYADGVNGQINLLDCRAPNKCSDSGHGFMILPPVIGGREITRDTFSFRYGTLQVTAKLPKGDWIVPELWLLPKNDIYGSSSARIVLAMARGNENLRDKDGLDYSAKRLEAGVYVGDKEYMFSYPGDKPWNDRYHTYRITWTPDEIKFFVDGYEFGHLMPPPEGLSPSLRRTKMAPFDQEFYLALGIHAGGDKDFPDTLTSKPWLNFDPKGRLLFWKAKNSWYPTWSPGGSGLSVERIDLIAM